MSGIKTANQESEKNAYKGNIIRSQKMETAQLKIDVRKIYVKFQYVWFNKGNARRTQNQISNFANVISKS